MNENINFQVGDVVEHILSKDWFFIIEVDYEKQMIKCRSKSHEIFSFHPFELKLR